LALRPHCAASRADRAPALPGCAGQSDQGKEPERAGQAHDELSHENTPSSAIALLERDDFSSNRHPALAFRWSMIFSENRHPLFGIMLFCWSMIFSENRYPLFGIML
jgi:hypothetical protein